MDFTFLDKCFLAIQPETWRRANELLGRYGVGQGAVNPKVIRGLPVGVCEGFCAAWYGGLSTHELMEDSLWVPERHAPYLPGWRVFNGDSSIGGGLVRSLRQSPSRCGLRR